MFVLATFMPVIAAQKKTTKNTGTDKTSENSENSKNKKKNKNLEINLT